jgi:O-antigen ligase
MFEDEHHGRNSSESTAEFAFRVHWVGLGLVAAIGGGGTAPWSLGIVAVLGVIGVALTGANQHTYGEKVREFTLRYLFWMLPVWVVTVTFLIGRYFPPYNQVTVGGIKFWQLLPLPASWMPVSTSFKVAGIGVLLAAGVYATTVNALLLCRSRLVFARTWAALVICAGALAILGLVQFAGHADQLLWVIPMQNNRFFASFPHPALWCAFAILWMSAGFGLLGWLVGQRGWNWQSLEGWLLLACTALLALSITAAGDPLHQILGAIVASLGCFVLAWQTWQGRRFSKHSGVGAAIPVWITAGLLFAAGAAFVTAKYPTNEWIRYDGQTPDWPLHQRVIEDARNMWLQRKWLGWGYNSFPVVYSFFQGADQNDTYHSVARSDFWQSLAEHGIIGTLVWWVPALCIVGRMLLRRRLLKFLIAPLAGLGAIVILSVVDFPFASPAVFFAFWFMLFSLARWVEVDRDDATFDPGERKRIEKLRGQGQTLAKRPTTFATPSAKPKSS